MQAEDAAQRALAERTAEAKDKDMELVQVKETVVSLQRDLEAANTGMDLTVDLAVLIGVAQKLLLCTRPWHRKKRRCGWQLLRRPPRRRPTEVPSLILLVP